MPDVELRADGFKLRADGFKLKEVLPQGLEAATRGVLRTRGAGL